MKDFFDWKAPDPNWLSMENMVEKEGPMANGSSREEYRKSYHIPKYAIDYERCHNTRRRTWVKGANAPIRDIIHGLQPHSAHNSKKRRRYCFNGTWFSVHANLEELIRKCAYGMRDPMIGAIETAIYGVKTNKTYDEYFAQLIDVLFTVTEDRYIEFPYIVDWHTKIDGMLNGYYDKRVPSLRCGEIPQSMFNSVYFFDGNIYDEEKNKWYNPTYQLVRVGDYFIMPLTVKQSRAPRSRRARSGESTPFTLVHKGRKFTFSLMEELWMLSELIRTPKEYWPPLNQMMERIHYWSGEKSDVAEWENLPDDDSLYMVFLRAHRCIRPDDTIANLAFEMFPKEEADFRLRHLKAGCDFIYNSKEPEAIWNCLRHSPLNTIFVVSFCIANLFFPWYLLKMYDGNIVMWACLILCAVVFSCTIFLTLKDRDKHDSFGVAFTFGLLLAYAFGALYRWNPGNANLVTAIQCLFWIGAILAGLASPIVAIAFYIQADGIDEERLNAIYNTYHRRWGEYNPPQPEEPAKKNTKTQYR